MRPLVLAGAILLGYVAGCTHRAELGLTQSVPELIDQAAAASGVPAWRMLRIARCESGYLVLAVNRRSGAAGVYQYLPATWRWMSAQAGFGGASVFDAVANVWTAAWAFSHGYWAHWRACL
jgi:hypothetical protein